MMMLNKPQIKKAAYTVIIVGAQSQSKHAYALEQLIYSSYTKFIIEKAQI
jgi:hypothetical protein